MQTGHQCANIQAAAEQVNETYIFIDPDTMEGGAGCDGHPNAATQQLMANVVGPAVKSMLKGE